jgi:uncharacterized membrane protein
MPVDVLTEIVIDRPRERVAEFSGNPTNAPKWYTNIKSVDWKTAPPIGVGSKMAFVAHFLGKRMAYTYEVIEMVPGEKLVMRTSEGPFPMETTYTWESVDDRRTRMTLRNRGEPTGFGKVVGPLMASAMRSTNRKDLARLKAFLERG